MSEQNYIVVISGGIIRQGTLFCDILSKDEFDRIMNTYEKFYSSDYNGCKSPIIKDKSINEIKNIIKNAIEKSNNDIIEDNNSIEDDDKKKIKKSRYIEESDNLYNFKITEFKQLLTKEFNFKNFNSFNRKEKEIKVKNENDDDKKEKNVIKKKEESDSSDEEKKPKKVIKKKTEKEDEVVKEPKKTETKKSETKKAETKKSESKKAETKKEDSKKNTGKIQVKKNVKTIDSDSDESDNVAIINETDSGEESD